jgi:acyl-CoA synthetase (NDP forming)
VPRVATIGNPLDYTALIWGEDETLREIVAAVADDPGVERVLVLYDQRVGIDGAPERSPVVERMAPAGAEPIVAARADAVAGEVLLEAGLELIELNPVLVHERGAIAVDAVAARPAP